MEREGERFHHTTQSRVQFKTYLRNVPFNIFRLWLTMSNKLQKAKLHIKGGVGDTTVFLSKMFNWI